MALLGATPLAAGSSTVAQWEQWQHVPGVFDVAGPRSDGELVVAAHTTLSVMNPDGVLAPYARAYTTPDGSESYIAMSPGLTVAGSGCAFARDDVYALDLSASTPAITRVTAAGEVSRFASISGASTLSGIIFDTAGDFGHRLLVIGPSSSAQTSVFAIDCSGAVSTVGTVATALEGGIAVAPATFGAYGGQLIAANETDGTVYAVAASGVLSAVAASGLPAGGDIGVESVGFVPVSGATVAYMSDRLTPGNPHPGTDSLLRLRSEALTQAGVLPGDALVGTEGGATVVDIHCRAACSARVVALGPPTAHGEGKIVMVPTAAASPGGVTPRSTAGIPAVVWFAIALGRTLLIALATTIARCSEAVYYLSTKSSAVASPEPPVARTFPPVLSNVRVKLGPSEPKFTLFS